MVRAATLILALIASAALAKPTDFSGRVAKAKASLTQTADKAFVSGWQNIGPKATELGVTASSIRAWTLWYISGYSLGLCRNRAPASLMADWLSAFDRLSFPGEIRAELQKKGDESVADGGNSTALADLDEAERALFCDAQLEAIRQLMN